MNQTKPTDPKPGEHKNPQEEWTIVGRFGRAIGLQGWIRVIVLTDFPERFDPGSRIYVQKASGVPELVKIRDSRDHFSGDIVEIKIDGIDTREAASGLVNKMLVIPRSERVELSDNTEFYPDELEGMQVAESDDRVVGRVVRLESEIPCPYILVETDDKKELMIPFRKVFIRSIDRKARVVNLVEPLSFHNPGE